jgi:hypothetical protein
LIGLHFVFLCHQPINGRVYGTREGVPFRFPPRVRSCKKSNAGILRLRLRMTSVESYVGTVERRGGVESVGVLRLRGALDALRFAQDDSFL